MKRPRVPESTRRRIECAALPCLIFLLWRRWSRRPRAWRPAWRRSCLLAAFVGGRRSEGGGAFAGGWGCTATREASCCGVGAAQWGGRGGCCEGDGVQPHPDRGGQGRGGRQGDRGS